MRRDEDHRLDHGADGFGGRLPVTWQDWAMIGIFIGFLAAAQLLIPRWIPAYYSAFGVGGAIFLAFCIGKTRIGRRWLEWLKAVLSDEPEGGRRARKTRQMRRTRR